MNIKYVVYTTICLCWGLSYAQLPPCINQFNILTTDWRVSPQTTGGAQVNSWDWTRDRFIGDVWIIENSGGNPSVCTNIWAPWHSSQINNPNVKHFVLEHQYSLGNRLDIYPNNGWELLTKNMGRLITDPQGNQVPEPVANPSFSLYNRRTGQIRFFLYVTSTTYASPRAVNIRLFYDNNVNGRKIEGHMLGHRDEVLVPLEKFKKGETQDGQAEFDGRPLDHDACDGKGYWIYADFWTNLDVCACEALYPASVSFDVRFIEDAIINMTIDGDITGSIVQTQYVNNTYLKNASPSLLHKGFKGVLDLQSMTQTGVYGFTKSYKSLFEFEDLMLKIAGTQKTAEASKIVAKGKFFGPKGLLVYGGLGMINHFIKQGKKDYSELQRVQDKPLDLEANFKINMIAKGKLTRNPQNILVPMFVPGSPLQINGYSSAKPIYNNVLGVFSVLSIPRLKWVTYNYPALSWSGFPESVPATVYQYKLGDEQINYYVNPASGLKLKSIRAQLMYKVKNGGLMVFNTRPYSYHPPYSGFFQFGNTEYDLCEGIDVLEKKHNASGIEVVNRTVDANSIDEMYFGLPFCPVTCVHDQTILSGQAPEQLDVAIKFHVIFEVDTNFASSEPIGGEYPPPIDGSNEVEYIVTYMVDIDDQPVDQEPRQICALIKGRLINEYDQICNMQDLSEHVIRNSGLTDRYDAEYRNGMLFKRMSPSPWPHIDAMEQLPVSLIIENTTLSGNQHIKAIRNIEVGANVTVTPGSTIQLQAGEEIVVKAENTLSPEFKGEIGFMAQSVPGFCERTYLPVDVRPFCASGSSYFNRAMSKRAAGIPEQPEVADFVPVPTARLATDVQPNPAKESSLYRFTLPEEDYLRVEVLNVSGNKVLNLVDYRYFPAGQFERILPVNNLAPGMYIIRLTTDKGYVATTRLVVMR